MNRNIKGSAILLTAAFLWGIAFSEQSVAADKVPAFLCNSLRSVVGVLFLLVYLFVRKGKRRFELLPKDSAKRKKFLRCGLICGILLTVAANFQQFGIMLYPDGIAGEARAGFLTALYVLLVPIFSVFGGKRADWKLWCAVILAVLGVYFLCLSSGISGIYLGDILVFCSAIAFAVHILAIDRFGAEVEGVRLSMMQFVVVAICSAVFSAFTERTTVTAVLSAAPQILYLGIVSSGIAYTLQIVGQKFAEPTVASISMSTESVFAALGGWILMGNALSLREICGCILVFCAIVLAQLPSRLKKSKKD